MKIKGMKKNNSSNKKMYKFKNNNKIRNQPKHNNKFKNSPYKNKPNIRHNNTQKLVEANTNHQCYLKKVKKNHQKNNKSLKNRIQIKMKKMKMYLLDLELQSKMMTKKRMKMMRIKINNDFSFIFICSYKIFHYYYKKCEKNQIFCSQFCIFLFISSPLLFT